MGPNCDGKPNFNHENGIKYLLFFSLCHCVSFFSIGYFYQYVYNKVEDVTMFEILIAAMIIINIVILLPSSYIMSKQNDGLLIGTRKSGHAYKQEKNKSTYWTLLQAGAVFISSIAAFHLLSIFFGAPLIASIDLTCHFAALLSTSTVLPVMIVLGCNLEDWIRVFVHGHYQHALEYLVVVTTFSSLFGAWLGAFPIPLDWDRRWQMWPISCVIGTIIGFSLGLLGVTTQFIYNHLKLQKKSR